MGSTFYTGGWVMNEQVGFPFIAGSDTSKAAAVRISHQPTKTDQVRRTILKAITQARGQGLTDAEGYAATGVDQNTYRPRRVELVALGLIEKGPRRNGSGAWVAR